MRKLAKKQAESSLFGGQKYKFEGYPEWYNNQLSKNKPIPIYLFENNLEKASNFYQKEATKFHFANSVLSIQLSAVNRQIEQLQMMISEVQENDNSSAQDKKKRFRRCANEIQRKYICPVSNCQKSYGTEGSMAQHMRLKHPGVSYNMADLNPDHQDIKQELKVEKKEEKVKKQHRKY